MLTAFFSSEGGRYGTRQNVCRWATTSCGAHKGSPFDLYSIPGTFEALNPSLILDAGCVHKASPRAGPGRPGFYQIDREII